MQRTRNLVIMLLISSALLIGTSIGLAAKLAPTAIGYDFEDGTTQGWHIYSHNINGDIALSNSTAQAYHGSHALALHTMDYNFSGNSQAVIASNPLIASSPITAYLYMITDDLQEPIPGTVHARLMLSDINGQTFSSTNTLLIHDQWVMLNMSIPNYASPPYTMSVALDYHNVRPTQRTVWLDYVQWSDDPPLPTSTPPATPTPTCHPYICEPLAVSLHATAIQSTSIELDAQANFDIGTYTFYRSTDGVNFAIVGSAQGHYGYFTDTGLTCGTTYYYYAHAQEYGWGQRHADSSILTTATLACGGTFTATPTPSSITPTVTPTCDPYICGPMHVSLQAMVVESTSVQLYAQADFDIGTYTLYRSSDGINFTAVDTAQGHYGYLDDAGLNCDTTYYYYAHADEYGGYQRSADSDTITIHTLPCNDATPTDTPTVWVDGTPIPPTETSTPTTTPTSACTNPFSDIGGNVFQNAIVSLYCKGTVNGTDATHYSPAATATRAQFAKVVVLSFAFPLLTPAGGPTFSDVSSSNFAYLYIESGYARGILSGFDASTCQANGLTAPCYLPGRNISRAQVTKLVVMAAGWPLLTPTGGQAHFSDVPTTHWAFSYVETSYANPHGIHGYPDGSFRPDNNIRRDEMAQVVYNASTTSAQSRH